MIGGLVTGGYGGHDYDKFADIDWSKDTEVIQISNITEEVKFSQTGENIFFKVDSSIYNIRAEIILEKFQVNSSSINFKVY